jgi:hypothetical protein
MRDLITSDSESSVVSWQLRRPSRTSATDESTPGTIGDYSTFVIGGVCECAFLMTEAAAADLRLAGRAQSRFLMLLLRGRASVPSA